MTLKTKVVLILVQLRTLLASIVTGIALAEWLHPVGAAEPVPTTNLDDYEKFVTPLFWQSCIDCHGPKKFVTFDVPLEELPRNPYRKTHEVRGSPNCTEWASKSTSKQATRAFLTEPELGRC